MLDHVRNASLDAIADGRARQGYDVVLQNQDVRIFCALGYASETAIDAEVLIRARIVYACLFRKLPVFFGDGVEIDEKLPREIGEPALAVSLQRPRYRLQCAKAQDANRDE